MRYVLRMRGIELRDIRKSLRLSQEEFGELVGFGRQAISDWERERNPIIACVELVARILEQNPEMLPQMERLRGMRK